MKGVLKTLVGLIFDDWWLAIGTLLAIILTKLALLIGISPKLSGMVLLLVILVSLGASLNNEFRKFSRGKS